MIATAHKSTITMAASTTSSSSCSSSTSSIDIVELPTANETNDVSPEYQIVISEEEASPNTIADYLVLSMVKKENSETSPNAISKNDSAPDKEGGGTVSSTNKNGPDVEDEKEEEKEEVKVGENTPPPKNDDGNNEEEKSDGGAVENDLDLQGDEDSSVLFWVAHDKLMTWMYEMDRSERMADLLLIELWVDDSHRSPSLPRSFAAAFGILTKTEQTKLLKHVKHCIERDLAQFGYGKYQREFDDLTVAKGMFPKTEGSLKQPNSLSKFSNEKGGTTPNMKHKEEDNKANGNENDTEQSQD